ncbi:hypothetical protein A2716_03345 [candidate division WWE3 bacterium RIFCSPHIGHO2_01_FULL_40_23]|uniref:Methyltransferase type 11 domain-containing protein n=1 Tax=candidate division WWE3 bacterium RIFCSPLOWO2_01_FULL_41_18 TaxID=1802625 RepID=A0A1F4VCI3_UNCKA|nr:MAG: hypothetical protein A2716_03345 [candidate division WWE3 bacterium RIFCSPHIGHO2_01_FULL_40_23]OGC54915.1 MAG: hypothetical protein A3A78_02955 [candidate division WWE3 bacterium RIFCSPLOWO2_01_FULL_41_18]
MEKLDFCPLCGEKGIQEVDDYAGIFKCLDCGYIFDNPRPSPKEIEEFYSKPSQYDLWVLEESARKRMWNRRLKKILSISKGGSLLDIGAGTGEFLNLAKGNFLKVLGTEVSESAIKTAKEKYEIKLTRLRAEEIQEIAEKFDAISLFHVLEHVHYPRDVIKICFMLLKKGGVLVIAVPNDVNSLKFLVKRFLRKFGIRKYGEGKMQFPKVVLDGSIREIHLSHFTTKTLTKVLEKEGFKVTDSSLDPYYAAKGLKLFAKDLYFMFHYVINLLFGVNFYDSIWVAARKE